MKFKEGDLVKVPGRIFCDSDGNLLGTIKDNGTIEAMYLVEINDSRFIEEKDITIIARKIRRRNEQL